jgi:hypothetical protein
MGVFRSSAALCRTRWHSYHINPSLIPGTSTLLLSCLRILNHIWPFLNHSCIFHICWQATQQHAFNIFISWTNIVPTFRSDTSHSLLSHARHSTVSSDSPPTSHGSSLWLIHSLAHAKNIAYTHTHIYTPLSWLNSPSWPGPPHCWGFTITLRHTIIGRTPLGEWSARRRDLCLATHNTHNRQTCRHPAVFEPAIPASERPQTHALD